MPPAPKPQHNIYKDQPYVVILDHTRRRGDTGDEQAATGIADMFTWLSNPTTKVEIPNTRVASAELSGKPGRYKGEISTALINAALFGATSYDKKRVRVNQGNTAGDVLGGFEVTAYATRDI